MFYQQSAKSVFMHQAGQVDFNVQLLKCNKWQQKQDLIIFLSNLFKAMLSYKSSFQQNQHSSTPNIDKLLAQERKIVAVCDSQQTREKDQIQSIRKMMNFMLYDRQATKNQQKIVNFEPSIKSSPLIKGEQTKKSDHKASYGKSHPQSINSSLLPQEGSKSRNHKIQRQNISKKLNNSNTQITLRNVNKLNFQNRNKVILPQNHSKINTKAQQSQKQLNYTRHNQAKSSKIIQAQGKIKQVISYKAKHKQQGTKDQVAKIFEEITKRGNQILQKRSSQLKKVEQQRKVQELKGFTFTPNLKSSKSSRNINSKSFLERLKDDQQKRQKRLAQIVRNQLKGNTFKPDINRSRNSQSKSKVNSFRSEDLPYFNFQSKPSTAFQKMLSSLSSSKHSVKSLTKSSVNQESNVKANEFSFIFE